MRKLNKVTPENLDTFLAHYIHVKNKTSKLSRRLREHVVEQFEEAKRLEYIKEENGKIFKKRFTTADDLQVAVEKLKNE
jgi:hypothetical protein